ncbi:TonB-dependent receptor [Flavicella sp.]|uniref:TonB-dependent receptor plug domain-containing protein n=1 Tax=Flavicella sp. TaxID=2957742 RepID=UPI00301A08F9
MKVCKVFFLLAVLCFKPVFSQVKNEGSESLDSIQNLEAVVISTEKFHKQEVLGQKTIELSVETIVKNPTNFTSLLRYNSPIVFKDYGNGGTSSARFRGTSASNTVVLWNGININSVGSGQTDFNSLSANTADKIIVKSGGGSVQYGSGAIGGTVHLKDILDFEEHQDYQLFTSYGSYHTTSSFFKSNLGTGKWAIKISGTYNKSDNDYAFIDDRYFDEDGNLLKNENGKYVNYSIDFCLGYKISNVNKLYFYSTGYYGDRLFSDGLPNPSAGSERNEDFNQRNLLKWEYKFGSFTQVINSAYITQEYRYYGDKDAENFEFGESKKSLLDYAIDYRFSNVWSLKYLMLYENTNGSTNYITSRIREAYSFGSILTFKSNSNLISSLGFRKEFNSDFEVPISVSLSAEYKLGSFIWLKTNISSNYRVPTYNEMYWPVVGNEDLIPEHSKQGELGVEFENYGFELNTTLFYIDIIDKIIWKPAGNSNLWTPINIDAAVNKGVELFVSYNKKIGKHSFRFFGNYIYAIATNSETGKQLPYAPKHLLNYNLEYTYNRVKIYLQELYQSDVYTNRLAIDFYSLDQVSVMNFGIDVTLYKTNKEEIVLGGKANNLCNELYYFTNLRPMPGRNYTININYKF